MNLISWNIQWGRGADGRVDLDRIVADARAFADFDVLCLQEVASNFPDLPGNDGSDQFAGLAARLPGFAAVAGVATDVADDAGGRRQFGNMLLSRWPVLQVFRHLLPWPPQPGTPTMQRLALEVTLAAPGDPLRVTTTHLEYYSPPQRHAQVERLRALQHEAAAHARAGAPGGKEVGPFRAPPRAGPAILAGDFNMAPDDPDKALLGAPIDAATPRYRDAWELAHPGRPHAPSVGLYDKQQWPGAPFTFDFIFVSDDLAARVADVAVDARSSASDHQPVLLRLK